MQFWKGRGHRNPISVGIIGGGFSGIAAAIALKKKGIHEVTIYEKSASVGGTWWDNRYPGAEVDTPSVLYSFSFAPWNWSRTHVRQAELHDYLERTAESFRLRPHLKLNTEVCRVEWIEERQQYEVTLGDGSVVRHRAIVSAVGLLNTPRYPDWPGLESFSGPKLHTSRWLPDLDVSGRTVAVVGSGSTAAQLVPALSADAGKVLMFQREPGWVLPKGDRAFTPEEREALNSTAAQRLVRFGMLWRREKAQYKNASWRPGTPQNAAAERGARRFIDDVFAQRPDLREAVTPNYPFGGKRPILTDDLYPALLKENVRLIPRAVRSVTERGLIDTAGVEHPIDILVMSTGFATNFEPTFDIIGRRGRKLTDLWDGDPQAFLGILVPEMPNFFMMYGPNTNGGAIVTHLEAQAGYIASAVQHLQRTGATALEVSVRAHRIFNDVIQKRLSGTSFEKANNYYKSDSGRVITQWSDGAIIYSALTRVLRRVVWRTERLIEKSANTVLPHSEFDDRAAVLPSGEEGVTCSCAS
ncbi:NAD(P)/FAD-dependent oxidoreductase [Nocardia sp. NPDC050378]|uniref:flavin-containing monooxygenase n=1 Tax=Nocardia sp. NPDC050378 TaxID=3155400 RepID=UPI003401C6EA